MSMSSSSRVLPWSQFSSLAALSLVTCTASTGTYHVIQSLYVDVRIELKNSNEGKDFCISSCFDHCTTTQHEHVVARQRASVHPFRSDTVAVKPKPVTVCSSLLTWHEDNLAMLQSFTEASSCMVNLQVLFTN